MTIAEGIASNSNYMSANCMVITDAAVTNQYMLITDNVLRLTSTGSHLINNAYITVGGGLLNSGTIDLAQGAYIGTGDYTHSAGTIAGPSVGTQTLNSARIYINGASSNASHINGDIIVYDRSLAPSSSNINLGFDVVTNPSLIGNGVQFGAQVIPGLGVGGAPGVITVCPLLGYLIGANVAPVTPILEGSNATLSANVTQVTFNCWPAPCYTPVSPAPTFVWQPGGQTGASIQAAPPSTQVYTVTATYQGCPLTFQVTVNVISPVYAVLKRSVDGGYYQVNVNNRLYFKYDEEYKSSQPLNYKIYDYTNVPICNSTLLLANYGDNRFSINLSTCGLTPNTYYTLEVTNEKDEHFYLKFKY